MTHFETEWQKMLNGEIYDAFMPEFYTRLVDTRRALWQFNNLSPDCLDEQREILRGLLGSCGENVVVNQPFRCDYGCNIHIGSNVIINFNLTVLDEAIVTIGNHAFIGPNVSIYTACHPLDAERRDLNVQWARPVTIGRSVWIGGNAVILPGVTVGDKAVIGAGSVVTKDVPPSTVVAGNPARPVRTIP